MELVIRAAAVYCILLLVFTIAGKRQLAEVDPFRLILLLIISEATQQALLDGDNSITGAATVIVVLVGLEMIMSFLKARFPAVEKAFTGGPVVLVHNGRKYDQRMKKENVDEDDIMSTARATHGLERLEQIKYAILEAGGDISIIPMKSAKT